MSTEASKGDFAAQYYHPLMSSRLSKNYTYLIDKESNRDKGGVKMTELNDEAKQRVKIVRYHENPFVEKMVVPVKGQIKKVDSEPFVKLFTANIALTFDLKSAGIKTFSVLVWILQQKGLQSNDLIPLNNLVLEDFLNSQDKKLALSRAIFQRGLSDLEKANIIAKNVRVGWYYINPSFIFNGDRKMN